MIHVAILEPDTRIASILKKMLDQAPSVGTVEHATGWADVRRLVALHTRSVVVLGPETDDKDLAHVLKVMRDYPGTAFVYVVDQVDAATLQKAMRHGIRDVVSVNEADAELAPAVVRAHAMADVDLGGRGRPTDKPKGKVVTVFGVKGGTGKTMVATNLAVLSAKAGTSTALLDGAIRFGDCAAVLRVRPTRSLGDLISVSGVPDETILGGVLTEHDSGLKLLCAPNDPIFADNFDSDVIEQVIEGLRRMHQLVIVDTGPSLDSHTLAAVAASDLAYLVTSLDLPAVKDAKLMLSMIDRLRLGDEKVQIVLNRANSKVGFPPDEVAKALGRPAVSELPSDVAVPRSINTGVPVAADAPKAKISRSLIKLSADMKETLFGAAPSGRKHLLRATQARTAES
jgi:pilus assembly protein CpaE